MAQWSTDIGFYLLVKQDTILFKHRKEKMEKNIDNTRHSVFAILQDSVFYCKFSLLNTVS